MAVMKIDITSDVICPFCLIGVKQMMNAIQKYKTLHSSSSLDFQIRLLPYQLNAGLSEQPQTRLDYYKRKFGEDRAEQIVESMGGRFAELGYKADFSGEISQTHLAHRLQTYALLQGPAKQLPLAMDIFEGFHCNRKHPSDRPWLASLAAKHGIFASEEVALKWLDGEECDLEVKKAYAMAQKLGVTGVPFFVFQDKYAASGAMGEDEFVKLLEEIEKRESLNSKDAKGENVAPVIGDMCKW
ncbi:hypothetical protein I317_02640 [Kwoniella heveanensis CBS 569]|nr:hypothetical protein I317_02640 [Kwoniella heveanensis CBS 569]